MKDTSDRDIGVVEDLVGPTTRSRLTPAIAMKLATRSTASEDAVVVGNRAGVIEWANESWTRITGWPSGELAGKPVSALLDAFGIDPSVVDFVQNNFVAGRRSTVELPVGTPDGRALWVHLEVDPQRDELGEVGFFVAVASDITERRRSESEEAQPGAEYGVTGAGRLREGEHGTLSLAAEGLRVGEMLEPLGEHITRLATSEERDAPETLRELAELGRAVKLLAHRLFHRGEWPVAPREAADLASLVQGVCRSLAGALPGRCLLDVQIGSGLPLADTHGERLHEVLLDLLEASASAVGTDWSTISVTVGVTRPGHLLESAVYHRGFVGTMHDDVQRLFIELHDTADALTPRELSRLRYGLLPASASPRASRLLIARALLAELDAELHVSSTVGAGTRLLVLLPAAHAKPA